MRGVSLHDRIKNVEIDKSTLDNLYGLKCYDKNAWSMALKGSKIRVTENLSLDSQEKGRLMT